MSLWWVLLFGAAALWAQSETAEQLFHEAVAAQQHGDNKLAIEKYQALVKLHPEAPEVRANLGAALAHEGRYDEAVRQYRAALEKVPTNAQLRMNLALAYYKKGDMPEATAELTVLHGNLTCRCARGDPAGRLLPARATLCRYGDIVATDRC